MFTIDEIINYYSNYKVEHGIVIDKKTNTPVLDEDTILKIKSAILIYNEAKFSYQEDVNQYGKKARTPEKYIKTTMEKFGVNNEKNDFGINKLLNEIIDSNGHYEENMSGNDLSYGKFSILVEPKKDYGLAYLRLKFRQKGLDIDDFQISQDTSKLIQDGYSRIIIDFKVKKYQNDNTSLFRHPKSKELNDLERKKQLARKNGNQKEFDYYQSMIEKIIRDNELTISPEEWDKLSEVEKIAFYERKMKEAKVLKDEVSYNFWNSNLRALQDKIKNGSALNHDTNNLVNKNQPKSFKHHYEQIIKLAKKYNSSSLTNEQRRNILKNIFYNKVLMMNKISNITDIQELINLFTTNLNNNEMEVRLSNIIIRELQEKYKSIKNENQQELFSEENTSPQL